MTEYEPVIGLEVHAQLLTRTKLFCGCSTNFGGAPNSNVCPVCLGLPGSLPVLNGAAVTMAVRAALALGCDIEQKSIFARKNYFYPDLPKGYQISQFEEPFSKHGSLEIDLDGVSRRVGITRVHNEEDAGKNVHGVGGDSLVDLNRAGVPLVEIVGEPDLRSSAEAAAYLRALRDVLVFLGVNDGNLEEGSFRCDANVSLRPRGATKFGTRCENQEHQLVSLRAARHRCRNRAPNGNFGRRRAHRAGDPQLRPRYRAHEKRCARRRTRTTTAISPSRICRHSCSMPRSSAQQTSALPELPAAMRRRFVEELKLPPAAALTLTGHPGYARFFAAACAGFDDPIKVANWVVNEVLRGAKSHGLEATFTVTPAQVAELLSLVEAGDISGKQAKELYAAVEGTDRSPRAVMDERGLRVVSDAGAIEAAVQRVLAAHPAQLASIRAGKKRRARVPRRSGHERDPKARPTRSS